MKKVVAVTLVVFVMALGTTTVSAQSPEGQFGIGVTVGGMSGAQLQYAITPAVHVGAGIGLGISDGNTNLAFAPYGKFIFAGSKEFKPFLIAIFSISSMSSGVTGAPSTTMTSLNFGGGAEYFITPNFGLFGGIIVIALPLSPSGSKVSFGILSPTAGLEWFF